MIIDKPTKNIDVASFHRAVNGMHHLVFLIGYREGRAKVDVASTVQRNRFFVVSMHQSTLEGGAKRVAAKAELDASFSLQVVGIGNHLRQPCRGACAAAAYSTITTMACTTENCELSLANETARRLVERDHLWRGIGNCRFSCLPLCREREGFQVPVGSGWVSSHTPLVRVDRCNP